jgi:hypothetical protein
MLNPALEEVAARDRISELRRGATKRSVDSRAYPTMEGTMASKGRRPIQSAHRADPQQAIGWFLVSVGLRLALSRSRGGSIR